MRMYLGQTRWNWMIYGIWFKTKWFFSSSKKAKNELVDHNNSIEALKDRLEREGIF